MLNIPESIGAFLNVTESSRTELSVQVHYNPNVFSLKIRNYYEWLLLETLSNSANRDFFSLFNDSIVNFMLL